MNVSYVIGLIASIIAGIGTAIPLVIQLVKYVKAAIKEKNWNKVLDLVMNLMEEAEGKFATGAEKKEWVLLSIKATADSIDYDIDMNAIGGLIDSLCDMSKIINGKNA